MFDDPGTAIVVVSRQQLQALQEASKNELRKSSEAPDIDRQRQAIVNSAVLDETVKQAQGYSGSVTVTREEVIGIVGEQMATLFSIRLTNPLSEARHWGMLDEAWTTAQSYA